MIIFAPLRTRRLNLQLHELSFEDAIYLCRLRTDMPEAGITDHLRRICTPDPAPRAGQVTDPRAWTVLERAMVSAHYIAHINADEPDFAVGDSGAHFSDYIRDGMDYAPDMVDVGTVGGDAWRARPILGADSESIERLIVSGRMKQTGRSGWRIGAMAATLVRNGESSPSPLEISDSEYDDWLENRIKVLMQYPESDFMTLFFSFMAALPQLDHLLSLSFGDEGPVFLANDLHKDGRAGLPPARFPVSSALSEGTMDVFGKA